MMVSEIQIVPVKPKGGLVAFASCVIDDSLFVGNIAIYTSLSNTEGYRLVFPTKALANGKEIQCVHPINREAGQKISRAIINKYEDLSMLMEGHLHSTSFAYKDKELTPDILNNEIQHFVGLKKQLRELKKKKTA